VKTIREIIRYGTMRDFSDRQIARALQVSRTVVARTLQAFRASGIEYKALENMPYSQIEKCLAPLAIPNPRQRYAVLGARFPAMVVELKKKGVTLQYLWDIYINEHPQGYQYSQFCLNFHHWRAAEEVTMHIHYKAGEAMLVDWAGDPLEVIDGNTGAPWLLQQFVAILGASQLTYVEARESQDEQNWIRANEGALHYFQGAPQVLIPDNNTLFGALRNIYNSARVKKIILFLFSSCPYID